MIGTFDCYSIGGTHICRISLFYLRPGAWVGVSVFSFGLGSRPDIGGLRHELPSTNPNDRLVAFAGAAAILNLALVVPPLQMTQIDRIIARHSAQLPLPRRPGNNVYFVRDGGFYRADLVQSDPLLRTDDLILFSGGDALDAELIRQNWPTAVLVERRLGVRGVESGPEGSTARCRRMLPGVKRFVFSYSGQAVLGGSSSARPRPES